jgi:hypothetical protein
MMLQPSRAPYRTPNLACKYKTSMEASIGFRVKIIISSSYEQKTKNRKPKYEW